MAPGPCLLCGWVADTMVQMFITKVALDAHGTRAVLFLSDADNERNVPIVIGLFEAQAIVSQMKADKHPRPMTHDLLHGIIEQAGYTLARVRITRLDRGTFYALLDLEDAEGEVMEVDARPSDGIALALRASAPIMVAEEVIREAEIPTEKTESEEYETFKRLMSTMSDEVESTDLESGSDLDIGPDDESVESQEE